MERVRTGEYGDVGGLLVIRHGKLVLEYYSLQDDPDDLFELASATKSVASALVGLAVDAGRIAGPEVPLHTLLPTLADLFAADTAKRAITLEHVLTMTSGLSWSESVPPAMLPSDGGDWMRVVLRQPLVAVPGSRFRYSTGGSLLVSGALETAYGLHAAEVAARHLFGPLGITRYRWASDSSGLTPTGAGLSLRIRDLAKLGQLYLDGGLYRGRRVISEAWVRRSTAPRITLSNGSRYGYLWWLLPDTTTGAADAFFARGYGETTLFVLPSQDLVVAVTAFNSVSGLLDPLAFVTSEILPLVR